MVRYDIISFFLAKMINLRDVEKMRKSYLTYEDILYN